MVRVNGRVISLRIALLNLGSTPVQLLGVGAENAADVVMPEPVVIDVYDEAVALVDLHFAQDIPGVFTAYLDFGEHGRGPVLVMP